ncbi:unnamed protein product [Protopolystoma xenopodis]|uniref:Uncharacterized protein n=1 Tax=Protopolystoma xenopodis TaxID=117903 RepID=A0A448WU67_9PLAT|nr:unnamed protein product [Protopolystoma xenopodis]
MLAVPRFPDLSGNIASPDAARSNYSLELSGDARSGSFWPVMARLKSATFGKTMLPPKPIRVLANVECSLDMASVLSTPPEGVEP